MIVQDSVRLRQAELLVSGVVRSEAEELGRGFGVQGKGAAWSEPLQ
jgi:hypothetical protein